MLKDKNNQPFSHQPPEVINKTRVDYIESSISIFRGKHWITMVPLIDDDPRIWEFCLDDGKIIKTK